MTGLAILAAALKEIGVLAAGETPGADDAADALVSANSWIDSLGTQRATMYATIRTVKTLASGTASYTIGSGGSINIVRPEEIRSAGLIVDSTASPTVEIPLRVLTDDEYAAVPEKSLQAGMVSGIYYDHGWTAGLGIIYPLPIPNVATLQLVLYTMQALTAIALATDYTFPPGYQRCLIKNIAVELAPQYGAQVSDGLQMAALDSLADVKRSNLRLADLSFDAGLLGGGRPAMNIYTGQ